MRLVPVAVALSVLVACNGGSDNDLSSIDSATDSADTGLSLDDPDSAVPGPDSGERDSGRISADSGVDSGTGDSGGPADSGTGDSGGPADSGSGDSASGGDTGDTGGVYVPPTTDPCDGIEAVAPEDVSLCTSGVAAVLGGTGYATVAAAVAAASSGDVVSVCPGTWTESLTVTSPVTLVGYGSGTSALSGGTTARIVEATASLRVVDLDLVDGYKDETVGDPGGTIFTSGDLCVARSAVTGSVGGAIYAWNSAAVVSLLEADFEDDSGYESPVATYGPLIVSQSTFTANSGRDGGAISASSTLTVTSSTFSGNAADYSGGAIYDTADADASITGSVFDSNTSGYEGGALHWGGWTSGYTMNITSSSFTSNIASYDGGALSLGDWEDSTVVISGSTFDGNSADADGGVITLSSWGGVTLVADTTTFSSNTSRRGAAIELGGWGVQEADFTDVDVTSSSGAAFDMGNRGTATLVMVGGSVTSTSGCGVYLDNDAVVDVTSSDWGTGATDNTPYDVCGYGSYSYGSSATFSCSGGSC